MTAYYSTKNHLFWIDALKTIGLYAIVSGHYTPPHYTLLYTFSVQIFFIISGFLIKHESFDAFWQKLTKRLIVPLLLLSIIALILNSLRCLVSGSFSFESMLNSLFGILYGSQPALGGLWFVYTLILCKVISQFATKFTFKVFISIVCLVLAYYYNNYTAHQFENSWLNIFLAYPMFCIGELFSRYREKINRISNKKILSSLFFVGFAGIIYAGHANSTVWMYRCLYGSNIWLFLLGSMSGTIMCFGLSKLLFDKSGYIFQILSEGSIIILAFHIQFVLIGLHFPIGYGFYFEAALIMIFFIPIILFCKKYCPILMGYRDFKRIEN